MQAKVIITVRTTHEYVVPNVNTPEEAEAIVEEMLEDGDVGVVSEVEIESVESYEASDMEAE